MSRREAWRSVNKLICSRTTQSSNFLTVRASSSSCKEIGAIKGPRRPTIFALITSCFIPISLNRPLVRTVNDARIADSCENNCHGKHTLLLRLHRCLPTTPEASPIQPAAIITPTPIPIPIVNPSTPPVALSPTNPSVTTPSPNITVSVPATSGPVTFQLVVTDNLGNQSAPATITIEIQPAPIAVLSTSTPSVRAGSPIELSAANSAAAAPGTITSYRYTLVSTP